MSYMQRFRASAANRWLQRILRVLQFLSAIISFALFTSRLVKIVRNSRRAYNSADGAVEGMLAAAVLYTLLGMIVSCFLRQGGPKLLRWLFVVLDILFVGAFIAVAVLTRPNNGPAGPNGGVCQNDSFAANAVPENFRRENNCNLPWGTFILAIVSTFLHLLTALFHEVKDRIHDRHVNNGHDGKEVRRDHSPSTV